MNTREEQDKIDKQLLEAFDKEMQACLRPGWEPKVYTETQMEQARRILELSGMRWREENDRADRNRTAFVCSLAVIAFLAFLVFVLKSYGN